MQHEWAEPSVPDPEFIGGVMLVREPGPCFLDHKPPVWHDKAEEFSEEDRPRLLTSRYSSWRC
jgi:hypothetical protein